MLVVLNAQLTSRDSYIIFAVFALALRPSLLAIVYEIPPRTEAYRTASFSSTTLLKVESCTSRPCIISKRTLDSEHIVMHDAINIVHPNRSFISIDRRGTCSSSLNGPTPIEFGTEGVVMFDDEQELKIIITIAIRSLASALSQSVE